VFCFSFPGNGGGVGVWVFGPAMCLCFLELFLADCCLGTATYLLLWPDDGVMKKDDMRRIFEGTIFYQKAEEHARAKANERVK